MSQERKKIERVLPPKPEAKKRVGQEVGHNVQVEKPETKVEEVISDDLVVETKKTRVKNPDKYVRFSFEELSNTNNISTINRRVISGEIKYAYYATDNDIGYHYYIINKK
jgi:hypothetical protein